MKFENISTKLKKTLQVGLAATAISAAGCEPSSDKATKEEIVTDPDFQKFEREWAAYEKKDEDLIKSYFAHVESGHFPANSKNAETLARARQIAFKKGFEVSDNIGEIEVVSSFNVPVQIKVKGQVVPVGPQDYTKRELELVRTAEMVGKQMGDVQTKQTEKTTAPKNKNVPEQRKSRGEF